MDANDANLKPRQQNQESYQKDGIANPKTAKGRHSLAQFLRAQPGSVHDLEDELCKRCERIDFRAIFKLEPDETMTTQGYPVFDLGESVTTADRESCKLCYMFESMVQSDQLKKRGKWHLRAFTTATLLNVRMKNPVKGHLSIIVVLVEGSLETRTNAQSRYDSIYGGVILSPFDASTQTTKMELLRQPVQRYNTVQAPRINEMLLSCESHEKCRLRENTLLDWPINAKLVHCKMREIVPMTRNTKVVALSYVLGTQRDNPIDFSLKEVIKLPELLPQTIDDAIDITQKLGIEYIWIDQYCVPPREKQQQIAQMANIYSHAYMTICTLGENDQAGLPGVSQGREKQISCHIQGMDLFWSGPSIQQHLHLSKWKTRGWTLQEGILSPKCMFFTTHDVVLVCRSDCVHENILSTYCNGIPFDRESKLYKREAEITSDDTEFAHTFDRFISEYQRRNLTYPADTLNAFRGILSQSDVSSYWGVPIFNQDSSYTSHIKGKSVQRGFLAGLTWHTRAARTMEGHQSKDVPSWSWIGQPHVSSFKLALGYGAGMTVSPDDTCYFQAGLQVKTPNDEVIGFEDFFAKSPQDRILPEQTKCIKVRSILAEWALQKDPSGNNSHLDLKIFVPDGSHPDIWSSQAWEKALYFDQYPIERSSRTMYCYYEGLPEKSPRKGFAILLSIGTSKKYQCIAYWLVVDHTTGGTFCRQGLMICTSGKKRQIGQTSHNDLPTRDEQRDISTIDIEMARYLAHNLQEHCIE